MIKVVLNNYLLTFLHELSCISVFEFFKILPVMVEAIFEEVRMDSK